MFFYPASGALVPRLVGEGPLTAANSLGAIRDNVIRMVGPSIGAAALALVGLPGLVLLDAASYLCSASMIALIAVPVRNADGDMAPLGTLDENKVVGITTSLQGFHFTMLAMEPPTKVPGP